MKRYLTAVVAVVWMLGCGNGTTPTDTGPGMDVVVQDTGVVATDTPAGDVVATDIAPTDSAVAFAPCAAADYAPATMITFGGAAGFVYTPKCVTVAVGGSVTFMGDFSFHPLTPSTRGTPNSPITMTNTTMMHTFTFPAAGYYPFYCSIHGTDLGTGMAGVIQVQ